MKINKMSTEDLRAAIAIHKTNRHSKYFQHLCDELGARQNVKVFIGMRGIREQKNFKYDDGRTIWSYNEWLKNFYYFIRLRRVIPDPELI